MKVTLAYNSGIWPWRKLKVKTFLRTPTFLRKRWEGVWWEYVDYYAEGDAMRVRRVRSPRLLAKLNEEYDYRAHLEAQQEAQP